MNVHIILRLFPILGIVDNVFEKFYQLRLYRYLSATYASPVASQISLLYNYSVTSISLNIHHTKKSQKNIMEIKDNIFYVTMFIYDEVFLRR
jgi:hypothetical protein